MGTAYHLGADAGHRFAFRRRIALMPSISCTIRRPLPPFRIAR
jgi:hypothetical protein